MCSIGGPEVVIVAGYRLARPLLLPLWFRSSLLMAALCSRCGHYVFAVALRFLSFFFFFSSLNLSGRRLDVYLTSTHGVALVQI